MNDPPLISIITPCLNRKRFLGAAIASVLAQNYPRYEHWVIDGGSTDGTLEFLKSYPHLRVLSERDKNLYDAINKGLRRATGELVVLLNTDDLLAPGALWAIANALARNPALDAVFGGAEFFHDASGRSIATLATREAISLTGPTLFLEPCNINARAFRPSVYAKLGLFDDRFPIAADRDFLIRVALDSGLRIEVVERVLYRYRLHDGSLTIRAGVTPRIFLDNLAVCEKHLADARFPPRLGPALRDGHAFALSAAVYLALRRRAWREALGLVVRGFRSNPLWPANAGRSIARRLLHRPRYANIK